jgi:hypothetical protein
MLGAISKNLTYASTTATLVGSLPPNAVPIQVIVTVGTAFNAGTTNVIDVGTSGTANAFANDVDVSSTGSATVTLASTGAVQSTTQSTDIYATFIPSGTAASAGSGYVTMVYDQL